MKKLIVLLPLSLGFLVSGCAPQAYLPSGLNSNIVYGGGQRAGSLHDKYSKKYADQNITIGTDTVMSIGMKFGEATFADKNKDGDIIWAYQARSAIISTDAKSATNVNGGLFSSSVVSASNINTETMSRITTLRITFDKNYTVKEYYSERELN
ncbi:MULTISPECIES: hypothetical protein [Colwellia]|uniref:Lipoprotein n=1 Tax=Colwellia marinimaniae TaxID=1513592 RepID=A0ABQ0MXS2_9GAMM|nr:MULTISPECIES: hypothetical protein [Colwellia]GAW97123.1 hypothetical protein MTCD1_02749 [Colwellia marinimaniae]